VSEFEAAVMCTILLSCQAYFVHTASDAAQFSFTCSYNSASATENLLTVKGRNLATGRVRCREVSSFCCISADRSCAYRVLQRDLYASVCPISGAGRRRYVFRLSVSLCVMGKVGF